MAGFSDPFTNVSSLSAVLRIGSELLLQQRQLQKEFVTGAPTTQPTTSFYYATTLHRNPISGENEAGYGIAEKDTDYMISNPVSSSSGSILFDKIDSVTSGEGHSSLEKSHELFFPALAASNETLSMSDLPIEYRVVDETAWPRIYAYFVVFVISALANFTELVWVCRRLRARASPVNRLFLHLCIADLIVVFMVAAVEVLWRISIGWYAGNFMCKAVMFSRAFGLYLSSLMIICISLDRYYAVVYPLRVIDASRRVKIMLMSAWATAAICAIPQSIVFREETHPHFPDFHQCSTLWWPGIERANTWLSVTMMYFIPLGVIIFAYGSIIFKIVGYLGQDRAEGGSFLRRNGIPVFQRAKLRTLKLTFMIVLAFVMCWSPYILISTWYLIDEKSATSLDGDLQDALFIWAVANSIANPLVYGFNESCKKRSKSQTVETCKEPEHRSDAVIMRNYNSSCNCTQKSRVRFSTHSPQQSVAAV